MKKEMNNTKFKIGDKIYRFGSFQHFFTYEIFDIIKSEKSGIFLHLRCEACRDHTPCEVEVCPSKEKQACGKEFVFIRMLNNYDNEDCDPQTYWHNEDDGKFKYYSCKNDALIAYYLNAKSNYQSGISKAERNIIGYKKDIEEVNAKLESLDYMTTTNKQGC